MRGGPLDPPTSTPGILRKFDANAGNLLRSTANSAPPNPREAFVRWKPLPTSPALPAPANAPSPCPHPRPDVRPRIRQPANRARA